jgi:enhancing lycopene biosynthesis protein 2
MEIDALIIPGGYGAAKNLSTFAKEGKGCKVSEDVAKLLREVHQGGKPIGAICIAPVILARVFGADLKPQLTIGSDHNTAKAIETMGAKHLNCAVSDVVVDKTNKFVTTPAYMLAKRISEVATGIEKLVKEVLAMSKK